MTPTHLATDRRLQLAMFVALAIGAICLLLIDAVLAPALLERAANDARQPRVGAGADAGGTANRSWKPDLGTGTFVPDAAAPSPSGPSFRSSPGDRFVVTFREGAGVWLSPDAGQLLDKIAKRMTAEQRLQLQVRGDGTNRLGKLRCQAVVYTLRRKGISTRRLSVQLDAAVQTERVELSLR